MKTQRICLALLGLVFATGCRSVDNIKICEQFVQQVNGELEECGLTQPENGYPLMAEDICPSELNKTNKSCQQYYDCLLASAQCVEGEYIGDPDPACGTC